MATGHPEEDEDHGKPRPRRHHIPHADRRAQRKVKFPTELDAIELCTPELRERLQPVARRLKEIEKERAERVKVRKRTKAAVADAKAKAAAPRQEAEADVEMADGAARAPVAGAELEDEGVYREKELKELEALVDAEVKKDVGASVSGQFELVGEWLPSCGV